MKLIFSILFFLNYLSVQALQSSLDRLRIRDSYLNSDIDSAILLTQEMLEFASEEKDAFGIVKANLYLGYLTKKQENYGKSVIYYLEGIRQAEQLEYEGILSDKIWLRRNLANTFRTFEANQLATQYNLEAIQLAESINDTSHLVNLYLNQGLVYQSSARFSLAIDFFKKILDLSEGYRYYEAINQIGIIFHEGKEYEKAAKYFNLLTGVSDEFIVFKAKALHNLAEIAFEKGQSEQSIDLLNRSISIKEVNKTGNYGLFLSYRNIGNYLLLSGDLKMAESFLQKGEILAEELNGDPEIFKIYQYLASLYLHKNQTDLSFQYQNTYYEKIQAYLDMQSEIQQQDKEYNFDLITKRYFDEVESQEKIASIIQTSKMSIGGLLTLLLLTIAYYRFDKVRTRKYIEKELVSLNIIED